MNVCNCPNASLIITTMKVHFVVLCQCIFEFIVNEKWSFFNWRGDTWVRKGDMNLIYWYIRQMTRWCVMYTGDCPPSLHTLMNGLYILYEWTLIFYECFQCPAQIFSTGWCTSPHHICHKCWLIASELFPSSKNCHHLNGRHIARRSPECVWGSLQSMTDSWDI